MTFEPVEDDDQVTEVLAERSRDRRDRAVPRPGRWKGPLTRRRERRILIALTYFGPLDEASLHHVLRVQDGRLTQALLNLAAEDMITYKNGISLLGDRRIWSMCRPKDGAR